MSEQTRPPLSPAELEAAVARIAASLSETDEQPLGQIRRIIKRLGVEQTEAFLARTQEIEDQGGMMLPDNSRRRTRGGVFFALVRQHLPKKDRAAIFAYPRFDKKAGGTGSPQTTPPGQEALRGLLAEVGQWRRGLASTVKITLVGRPGPLQQTGRPGQPAEFVAFPMESAKAPALPKGMPGTTAPTRFLVLVSGRQWRRIAETLRNPQDKLIVEGYSSIDARVPDMITVRAINVTTVETQRAMRAKQQAQATQEGAAAPESQGDAA